MLLGRQQALGVTELARLGLFVAEAKSQREAAGECPPTEVEHPGALDPALAPALLTCAAAGESVRLGDGARQLQVELAHHGVDRVDVSHRGERVEDSDL